MSPQSAPAGLRSKGEKPTPTSFSQLILKEENRSRHQTEGRAVYPPPATGLILGSIPCVTAESGSLARPGLNARVSHFPLPQVYSSGPVSDLLTLGEPSFNCPSQVFVLQINQVIIAPPCCWERNPASGSVSRQQSPGGYPAVHERGSPQALLNSVNEAGQPDSRKLLPARRLQAELRFRAGEPVLSFFANPLWGDREPWHLASLGWA